MPTLPRSLGRPVRHLGAVGSTMAEAAAWAADGAPHGATVTAAHQTAGRGRHGRIWTDVPGEGLMLSVVLRLGADRVGLVPLAAGLAVAEAVGALGVEAWIKWPNDVLVGGKKMAGVLAEATWSAGRPVVVLGLGLNVRQRAFPPDLAGRATSLRIETGRDPDPLGLLDPILDRLAERLAQAETDPDALLREIEDRMVGRGTVVSVAAPGAATGTSGRVLGLAPDGALRLDVDGEARTVHAGEVTLAAPPSAVARHRVRS